ncbi:hypothetical protein ASPFODRAFT_415299 [Aspergillus luchuensis CBS 106.47]|uniref:Uncharacterized protein n=1 Tax=Aspergillus luchuensis (strain CBS 106.47) TaxID=1137211 RepID=A0A1M3TTY6_ASPLC|nr:hypothetical protein ASPFODRAFT_415299 [Aspergillus luchuensis CBS 106.47]
MTWIPLGWIALHVCIIAILVSTTKRRSIGGLSCLRCPVTTTTTGQTVPPDSPPSRPPFSFPCSLILPSSFIPNHTWYSCHCRSVCLDRHLHPPVAIPRSPLPHTPHAITAINTINSHGTWPSRNFAMSIISIIPRWREKNCPDDIRNEQSSVSLVC